jgi:phage-related protein
MASIYDTVPSWGSSTIYSKYDIVLGSDSKYYYSIIDSNSNQNPITTANLQVEWDGYILLNSVLYPNFFWKPSYTSAVNNSPKITINAFGNGYQQRISSGLNNNLINLSLLFENRSEKETVSILHFLRARNSVESFIYNLPTIYAKSTSNLNTLFICLQWDVSFVSYNNYSIKAEFIEVPQ